MRDKKNLILAAVLALAAGATSAQTVWRCGNSYSTQPCAGGSSFEVPSAPGKAEAAQAEKAARVDASRAAVLEKARLQQEKNAPKAVVIGPIEPAVKPATEKKRDKPKGKPEAFTASAPGPAKKAK